MTTNSREAAPGVSGSAGLPAPAAPGIALLVIAGAQLMVALDVTIVNIALPHIQSALHFSGAGLAWVIDAYTLVFGGLMLLGGRAADFLGRKRMFIIGLTLFAAASLAGGLANSAGLLIAARAVQGVGAAIASPSALSLITTVFPEGKSRNRALAAYAGATGGGGVLGLIVGGLLTETLSWRWVLFVNVIIGGLLIAAAPRAIPDTPRSLTGRPSVLSAFLSVVGVGALVYGFLHAASDSWRNPVTIAAFAVAAVGIAAFAVTQARSARPLLPLRLFRNRNRVGSHLMGMAIGAAMFSMFYFLTQFVQEILGYSPIRAGLAFLPLMVLLGATAQIGGRIIGRTGPKPLLIFGAVWLLVALLWLSRISEGSTYAGRVLPALLILGVGVGMFFVPLAGTAVAGVTDRDAGIASAAYNMFFQIGGAIGLAALTTVASTAIHHDLPLPRTAASATSAASHPVAAVPAHLLAHALAHGWATAFAAGAGFAALALLVALAVVHVRADEISPAHVH